MKVIPNIRYAGLDVPLLRMADLYLFLAEQKGWYGFIW
jgi:hypothetical protein